MRYCKTCGAEVVDGHKYCGVCGADMYEQPRVQPRNDGLITAALVFIIITICWLGLFGVIMCLSFMMANNVVPQGTPDEHDLFRLSISSLVGCILPLAWVIPMLVRTVKIRNGAAPNTTGFGVCVLLFCNVVAGILLLCAPKGNQGGQNNYIEGGQSNG